MTARSRSTACLATQISAGHVLAGTGAAGIPTKGVLPQLQRLPIRLGVERAGDRPRGAVLLLALRTWRVYCLSPAFCYRSMLRVL